MSLEAKETKKIITILGSTGDFRMSVPEGTEGAETREYETSDGKKGVKHELVFRSVSGKISNVEFFEGDFGKNLLLTITDEDEPEAITVSIGCGTQHGEDFMKKFPGIDLDKEVNLRPFTFTDEKGKSVRGIAVTQDGEAVKNAYWDAEKKKSLLGYPEPEGDTTKFDSEDWKMYFTKCRKHTMKWIEDNVVTKK